jgi:hypothetical protein
MQFLTFSELEKKVTETYQNATPQSVKTAIFQRQRLFKIQFAESNNSQKVLTDEIFRYESKFDFEGNKYLFEGKKALVTSLKQDLAIQKGLLKPEIVDFADFYDLDKLVLNPHYGSVLCTFDSQMTAKDMLLLDVFYLSWLKHYTPSVSQPETPPSVSFESLFNDVRYFEISINALKSLGIFNDSGEFIDRKGNKRAFVALLQVLTKRNVLKHFSRDIYADAMAKHFGITLSGRYLDNLLSTNDELYLDILGLIPPKN